MSENYQNYCEEVERLGFQKVYEEKFLGSYTSETYCIYWNPKGYLLTVESFTLPDREPGLNRGTLFYNVQMTKDQIGDFWRIYSSGSYVIYDEFENTYIWGGYHTVNCNPQLVMKILESHGQVLPIPRCFINLWLVNYNEEKVRDDKLWNVRHAFYDTCRDKKIACFPSPLKEQIQATVETEKDIHCFK